MTAKEERLLFNELCSALEDPPDHARLEQIVKDWKKYGFDTDFDEFYRASSVLELYAQKSEQVNELVQQVTSFGFLTQYPAADDCELPAEPRAVPTCLQALYSHLQSWPSADCPKERFPKAFTLLARHVETVRAALHAGDERMLQILLKWNGSLPSFRHGNLSQEPELLSQVEAWLTQQRDRRSKWKTEINCGRVPDELELTSDQAELVIAAGVMHSPRMPLIANQELFEWVRHFEEHVLKTQVIVVSLIDPHMRRHLECSIQFGTTLFITDFDGEVPDFGLNALKGDFFKVGALQMVRIGDNVVEAAPNFRRYIISGTPTLHLTPESSVLFVQVEVARRVFQVLHVLTEDCDNLTLSAADLGGTEVTRLQVSPNETVGGLMAAIAQECSLEKYEFELVFPNAKSSRNLPQSNVLSQFI